MAHLDLQFPDLTAEIGFNVGVELLDLAAGTRLARHRNYHLLRLILGK